MKKRVFLIILAVLLIVSLTACGKKGLEGKWRYVAGDTGSLEEFGNALIMNFNNGKLTMELDPKATGITAEQRQAFTQLMGMTTMTYVIKSATQIEMTMTMFGETDTSTVDYKLDGDTLTFQGAQFKRQ